MNDVERTQASGTQRCERVLMVLSLAFAALGLLWVVLGTLDPFGVYDAQLASALLGVPSLPDAAQNSERYDTVITTLPFLCPRST